MGNEHIDIDYSLRFIGIEKCALEVLLRLWGKELVSVRKDLKNKDRYIVVLKVDENTEQELIYQSLLGAKSGEKDIFVSFTTNSDSEIFELPFFIVSLSAQYNLKMNISYTAIFDEE